MVKRYWWLAGVFMLFSVALVSWKVDRSNKVKVANELRDSSAIKVSVNTAAHSAAHDLLTQYVDNIYQAAQLGATGLNEQVFEKALTGFENLKMANMLPQNSNILTVIDFNRSSRQKRMWIIDLLNKRLLMHTWVAHGEGSGPDVPNYFSNSNDSYASSLGFYLTDNVYVGKHGRSLRLNGLDEGFNDNARKRGVVIHAADYVCQHSIDLLGRLGRSQGCPAVSPKVVNQVIDMLKDHTTIFINGNEAGYTSKYLNEDQAAAFAFAPVNKTADTNTNAAPAVTAAIAAAK